MDETKNARAVFIDTSAILFQDDFESGAGQWTVQSGAWTVVTEGTQVYSTSQTVGIDFSRSVISNTQTPGWTDYTFRARVKPLAGQYAMLMVRYQDARNHYFMDLRTDNGKIEIKKMVNGSSGSALKSVSAGITAGTWYTAELEVVGTQLRGYLNGALVITATDPLANPPFMTGGVGVGTLNNSAEFDDVHGFFAGSDLHTHGQTHGHRLGHGEQHSDRVGLRSQLRCRLQRRRVGHARRHT